jgi:PTH1 family peptidyl-tRNA hydrolase
VKIILGLGNPGDRYQRTRHNLGFLVVDRLASSKGVPIEARKYGALVGEWRRDDEKVLFVKSLTYMNRSGEAVRALFRYHPVSAADLIVVHDDLDLPYGRIRIRARGGAGGHRGVLSILEALQDDGFVRVRIGIGRPLPGEDPTEFVLKSFLPEEKAVLDRVVSNAADAVDALLEEGCERAMQKFNRVSDLNA